MVETFSWQDPVHSWKAGPGEVMTVENLFYLVTNWPVHKLQICKSVLIEFAPSK
jgi:hypothetical protein